MRLSRRIEDRDCRMFVLDVLKYDIEQIESILNLLNDDTGIGYRPFWGRPFETAEVTKWLAELADSALVEICHERDGYLVPVDDNPDLNENTVGDYWFRLMRRGEEALERWDPPVDLDESSGDEG